MRNDTRLLALATLLALGLLWPGQAQAQEGAPRELRIERHPTDVTPALPAADPRRMDVERDSQRALDELRARERADALVRETVEIPTRRPDLSRDIVEGIQSRNLHDALRR